MALRRKSDTLSAVVFVFLYKAKNNTDGLDPPGMPFPDIVVGSEANVWSNSETFVIFTIFWIETLYARATNILQP